MVRNENDYIEHVKEYKRRINYMKALRALSKSRHENPAYNDAFNSLMSDLKKKNPRWSRTSVDDHDLTARTLFTDKNTDEEL